MIMRKCTRSLKKSLKSTVILSRDLDVSCKETDFATELKVFTRNG